MTKNQGIKVNLNTYKIKQISLWLAHWALQVLASTLHSWQTHRNWISIHLVLPRGWKWHSNNFLCKKQTNKQTKKQKYIWKVVAICFKSMQYSETPPYGHHGNTAVWSLHYLAPFLAAWQNGHTFSCEKTLINTVIH